MAAQGLVNGPLGDRFVHLCVDMQRLFGPGYPWAFPWSEKVMPEVEALCALCSDRTIFTRFIPPRRPQDAGGTWAQYYQRWADVTLEQVGTDAVRLMPELERFVPPARVFDKAVYSPWFDGKLDQLLPSQVDTVIISGGETDVCVLATVMGAVDRGLRVVLAADALCSSSDATHDALMQLYLNRFSMQVEASTTAEIAASLVI
jgi:nicotinamidase-related amidase